jgi:hypothetical protein
VCERRHLRQELGRDVVARHEQIDGIGPGRGDEVLALRDKEAELVPPAPVVELSDELEPLVVAGGDQARVSRTP